MDKYKNIFWQFHSSFTTSTPSEKEQKTLVARRRLNQALEKHSDL